MAGDVGKRPGAMGLAGKLWRRLLAEALTFVDVVGNALAAIVVARSEKAVALEVMKAKIGARPLFGRA